MEAGHEVALVLTQPDRPAGRGLRPGFSPVKCLAQSRGLELLQPLNLKSEEPLRRIAAVRPDALVVAAYGLIFPPALLAVARHGALNIHASLLPRWRGAAPIQRALLAGDTQTGVSIMQMDPGLDTGPVFARRALPIGPYDDAGSLSDKLAELGAEMILQTLIALSRGEARAEPQLDSGATYASKVDKRETLLDWSRPAAELERAVRAFRPAPGAFTRLAGETLKIWRARVTEGSLPPGLLAQRSGELMAGCGRDLLTIEELQRAGGKRVAAAEFLRGRPLAPGAQFG